MERLQANVAVVAAAEYRMCKTQLSDSVRNSTAEHFREQIVREDWKAHTGAFVKQVD
jgi:hypothetical protein